jgi:hypothetical protein
MRSLYALCLTALILFNCQENESGDTDFTGNQMVYALTPGSIYQTSGTVTFKEKKDGSTLVLVNLEGTEGNLQHPVHLHLGSIATPGADVTALLNPVLSKTGKSETLLTRLADESAVSYADILNLNACIKVHLGAAGPDRDIILAGGNIGKSADTSHGRQSMEVCKSE